LEFHPNGGFFARHDDLVGADTVHQFVHQDVGEEGIEGNALLEIRGEHDPGDGDQDLVELALLDVFQHDPLGPLFFYHTGSLGKL